jgi:hypothetical protein
LEVEIGDSSSRRELVRLESFTSLLEQALFTLGLPDLHHIVFSPPPTFIGVDSHLVPVPANLSPRARPHDIVLSEPK